MPLTNGQTFAGYTILRLLGSGAMGEVYLVQHPRLPRHDALKVLPIVGRSVGEAQVTAARATGLQRGGLGCGTRPAEGERQALLRVETRVRVIRILYLPLTRSWLQSGVSSKESSGASGS